MGIWVVLSLLSCLVVKILSDAPRITDSEFRFGTEKFKYVIYRIIGNDLPPWQSDTQHYLNTKYTLENEASLYNVQKRWILNRIWNQTTFKMIYKLLVESGVNRRDIIPNCFDADVYNKFTTPEQKVFYLTSLNEGRNTGIKDGKESGFEWTLVLDGNSFVTTDAWKRINTQLMRGTKDGKLYMKIPMRRLHKPQDESWLNWYTTVDGVVQYANQIGEYQIAFYKTSTSIFSPTVLTSNMRGPATRVNSLLSPNGACGPKGKACLCSSEEEDDDESNSLVDTCGLVLRLWHHPNDITSLISAGMDDKSDEEGFFCYVQEVEVKAKGSVHKVL